MSAMFRRSCHRSAWRNVTAPTPFNITDQTSLLGWNIGTYVQDEWKITNQLTLNTGVRFDQLYQFIDTNQFSPRIALVYKPSQSTTMHIGYSRYFTPPYQAQATQSNFVLFNDTTNQSDIQQATPVKPERSNYFDAGIDQTVLPGLNMGIDLYYKQAKDMIDDGQFGQAVVLTQFNWARGYSEGGEFKLSYTNGNFYAYGNFAYNISRAIGPESSQYLFDADEFAYLQTHWHYTDDMQRMTGSAGASYRFMNSTTISADMIYGSGLRSGELPDFAPNDQHTTPYAVINTGIIARLSAGRRTTSPPPCGSTSPTCSTRSTSCATAAASASSHRNSARAAATIWACRRSCDLRPR